VGRIVDEFVGAATNESELQDVTLSDVSAPPNRGKPAMARVGEPIVATPPPLPAGGEGGTPGGSARGPKIGSKGQSRSRAREHVTGGSQTPTRAGEGDGGQSEERVREALNREGSFDSEVDEQRNNRRSVLSSPVDPSASGEHPHTPVNGASAAAAPKAVRRLRDTSNSTSNPGLSRGRALGCLLHAQSVRSSFYCT